MLWHKFHLPIVHLLSVKLLFQKNPGNNLLLPFQQEFYRELNQRRIPLSDSPQEFILHLTNNTEIGTSIFLHRLRLGQIPFAQNMETVASAYDYLTRVKEKWQVQWTPAVDASLV